VDYENTKIIQHATKNMWSAVIPFESKGKARNCVHVSMYVCVHACRGKGKSVYVNSNNTVCSDVSCFNFEYEMYVYVCLELIWEGTL